MRTTKRMTIISVTVGLICLAVTSGAQESETNHRLVCLDAEHVTVDVLPEPLPADSTALKEFLWEHYITGADGDSFACRVWDCPELWPSFSQALVAQAEGLSLDAEGLRACLELIGSETHRLAYLPVGASWATLGDENVWVIHVKWERKDCSSREVLGHGRVFVLTAKDPHLVFFATCS